MDFAQLTAGLSTLPESVDDVAQRVVRLEHAAGRIEAQLATLAAQQDRILLAVIPPTIIFSVDLEGQHIEGENELILTATQKFTVSITARDAKGNPAQFDGAPVFATDRPDVLSVVPSADGMTAEVSAVGPVGMAQLTATVDAKMGPEVKTVIGTLSVEVVAGEAAVVALDASAPVEQVASGGAAAGV